MSIEFTLRPTLPGLGTRLSFEIVGASLDGVRAAATGSAVLCLLKREAYPAANSLFLKVFDGNEKTRDALVERFRGPITSSIPGAGSGVYQVDSVQSDPEDYALFDWLLMRQGERLSLSNASLPEWDTLLAERFKPKMPKGFVALPELESFRFAEFCKEIKYVPKEGTDFVRIGNAPVLVGIQRKLYEEFVAWLEGKKWWPLEGIQSPNTRRPRPFINLVATDAPSAEPATSQPIWSTISAGLSPDWLLFLETSYVPVAEWRVLDTGEIRTLTEYFLAFSDWLRGNPRVLKATGTVLVQGRKLRCDDA